MTPSRFLCVLFLFVFFIGLAGALLGCVDESVTTWTGVPAGKGASCSRARSSGPWTCIVESRAYLCVEGTQRMDCAPMTIIPPPPPAEAP